MLNVIASANDSIQLCRRALRRVHVHTAQFLTEGLDDLPVTDGSTTAKGHGGYENDPERHGFDESRDSGRLGIKNRRIATGRCASARASIAPVRLGPSSRAPA
jgi:hypothetical protein